MCLALQSYARNNDIPSEYQDTLATVIDLYRIRTAQCLITADITRLVYLMIETMLCYAFIEYTYERDGDMGTLLLSGNIMRLALQQGYHRDPDQHSALSVYEGEMRRRVWLIVTQHELLFSVQIGLPKSIKLAECDTKEPRNLRLEELSEDMTILPPSRPDDESTHNCYQRVQSRNTRAYGYVIEFLHTVEPQPYTEVIRLDEMLKKNTTIRFPRISNLALFLKWLTRPHPILPKNSFFKSFTIKLHFFFIANIGTLHYLETQTNFDGFQDKKSEALIRARDIWREVEGKCKDAKRAVDILGSLIKRLTVKVQNNVVLNVNPECVKQPPIVTTINEANAEMLGNSVPMYTDISVPMIFANQDDSFNDISMIPENMFDTGGIFGTFGEQVDVPGDFDWDAWDQITIGPHALGQERDLEMRENYWL
ncbi:uncharacterized protein EAF02_005571 [Botrytis sinoallii]|uniref:uncharacterized protein n=1 Tax=Botrytis sinoallii TaxID=1463999 RepID=UPI0018FF4E3F|nr:uncharacterized protein EAF02_005571 [Botrytis sinoallii]KAF7883651.1 hypothetical protein EAF02_005571 [Botrytis sinoallii]